MASAGSNRLLCRKVKAGMQVTISSPLPGKGSDMKHIAYKGLSFLSQLCISSVMLLS